MLRKSRAMCRLRQRMAEELSTPSAIDPDTWREGMLAAGDRFPAAFKLGGELSSLVSRQRLDDLEGTPEKVSSACEDCASAVSRLRKNSGNRIWGKKG
jgi:hypothetical protein